MRDVSIGQYYPVSSPVHKMDARAKLVIAVLYMVMLFFIPTVSKYIGGGGSVKAYMLLAGVSYAAVLLFLVLAVGLSRVPFFKVLKSVKALLYLLIFMGLITVFFYGGTVGEGSWQVKWWVITISTESLVNAGTMMLRLVFLVMGPAVLTLTTTPVELTDGLESLLTPLKWIKFPVHELAIIMSIALRLIPTLSEETEKIMNAQKARCADFESGNLFKRAKALMPILIPLFVSSFRRANDLADAMDSRCYHGAKGRTRMKRLRFSLKDLFAFLIAAAVFFAILTLKYGWFGFSGLILSWIGL